MITKCEEYPILEDENGHWVTYKGYRPIHILSIGFELEPINFNMISKSEYTLPHRNDIDPVHRKKHDGS